MNFISINNMKWKCCKMYQNIFWEYKTFFETKKSKPRSLFLFSSKGIPSTPQHPDSHPCTRPCDQSSEDHKKIMAKSSDNIGNLRWLFGNFYGKLTEIIGLQAPGNYSASIRTYNFLICLWERPKLLISMILGFLEVSPSPKTNIFIFRDPRIPQIMQENPKSI